MDTDSNGCITQDEFNQNAGEDAPAYGDVARLDGKPDCISKEDLNQYLLGTEDLGAFALHTFEHVCRSLTCSSSLRVSRARARSLAL